MKNSTITRAKSLIYAYIFSNKFILYLSLLPLIYTSQGLTLTEISILTLVANLSVFLFEIPTGIIADRLGKKQSVRMGIFVDCIGIFYILVSAKNFYSFFLWVIIQGLGVALVSGADSAMIFEYLKANKSEIEYHKVVSNISFLSRTSAFLATIVCGRLITISFNAALAATLGAKAISLALISFFPATAHSQVSDKVSIKQYFKSVIDGFALYKKNKDFWVYALFNAFLLGAPGIIWEYRSLLIFDKLNLNTAQTALVVSFLNLFMAMSFLASKKLSGILEKDKYLLLYLISPLSIVAIAVLKGGAPWFFSSCLFLSTQCFLHLSTTN